MKLAIGSDHGGFLLKKEIMNQLSGYQWVDCGTYDESSCDYPDFAFKVGEKVASHECDFGIVICKSGIGVSICANKVKGIRCALVDNEKDAVLSKQHNPLRQIQRWLHLPMIFPISNCSFMFSPVPGTYSTSTPYSRQTDSRPTAKPPPTKLIFHSPLYL